MSNIVPVDTTPSVEPSIEIDPELRDTDRPGIYLDGTLVLVGCGKAKRDPTDPTDVHLASTGPEEPMGPGWMDETGPAWRAEDLYTSSYFASKRSFAERVTAWTHGYDATPWAVLSAEHAVVPNWQELTPYDTTISDLGDDPTNPEHRATHPFRRPDGGEAVTQLDKWAANVALTLSKWVAGYREMGAKPWENDANSLLVLAGQDYIEPLRERGVFEYGNARMTGNPNEGFTFPLDVRFLFEEIPAGGMFEQMAWLSDALDRLPDQPAETEQHDLGKWNGSTPTCDECGRSAPLVTLRDYDGMTCCEDCQPKECSRCGGFTHETAKFGTYPLCLDCRREDGGRIREAYGVDVSTTQDELQHVSTDGSGEVDDDD